METLVEAALASMAGKGQGVLRYKEMERLASGV